MSAFVRAVVRAVLAGPEGPAAPEIETEAQLFVQRQIARLPDFLRLPVTLAGHSLDALALATYQKTFVGLDLVQQRYIVSLARRSAAGPVRDAVRFYESLAIFVREGLATDG
jgi:hypothetical protein